MQELGEVFDELESRTEIGVAIVTGGGTKAFVAGADIKGFKDFIGSREAAFKSSRSMQAVFSKIENSRLAVIAAVNGLALGGGCELAAACDIRVGGDNIVIGVPEVKLGLIPGAGRHAAPGEAAGKGPGQADGINGRLLQGPGSVTRWGCWTRSSLPRKSFPRQRK